MKKALKGRGQEPCAPESSSGAGGADLLLREFLFSAEPVLEVVAVFLASFLVEFMRTQADLGFEIGCFARHGCGWLLWGI
jgi:hypothetical protein